MNRIASHFTGCTCNHSQHVRWLDRLKQIIEEIETAADLDCFETFHPSLYCLIEDGKDRSVRIALWHEADEITDINNLPSITVGIMRDYAAELLAAARRIEVSK